MKKPETKVRAKRMDANQLAKRILDISTGERTEQGSPTSRNKPDKKK